MAQWWVYWSTGRTEPSISTVPTTHLKFWTILKRWALSQNYQDLFCGWQRFGSWPVWSNWPMAVSVAQLMMVYSLATRSPLLLLSSLPTRSPASNNPGWHTAIEKALLAGVKAFDSDSDSRLLQIRSNLAPSGVAQWKTVIRKNFNR